MNSGHRASLPRDSGRVEYLPCGAITGIGSLPMTNADAAVDFVRDRSPEIPFWPQLPQISGRESIIGQGLGAIHDLIQPCPDAYGYEVKPGKVDVVLERFWNGSGELAPSHASGFYAFERRAGVSGFPAAVAVKGQFEGPITLASYLYCDGRPFVGDPALFAAVTAHVSRSVAWQSRRLAAFGLTVLLFIDEPGLCTIRMAGRIVSEARLIEGLRVAIRSGQSAGATVGLHCCAARPFSQMCRAQPDVLSFDAHGDLESFVADSGVRAFVRDGGCVAYGMIPTVSRLNELQPEAIFSRWLEAALVLGDPIEIARRSFITATCGLGLLDETAADASFRLGRRVSELIGRIGRHGLAEGRSIGGYPNYAAGQ